MQKTLCKSFQGIIARRANTVSSYPIRENTGLFLSQSLITKEPHTLRFDAIKVSWKLSYGSTEIEKIEEV